MANPQKENGYIAIATELFEAMMSFRIPGECEQVLKAILRKTYGYNKKEDSISNSQFALMTNLKKGNISRSLSKLITNKVVIRSDNNKRTGNIYQINKDYQAWIPFVIRSDNKKKNKKLLSKRKPLLSKVITTVIRSDNKLLSEVMDTIDNNHIITNIQKTQANRVRVGQKKKAMKKETKRVYTLQGSQWNFLIDAFAPVNPMYKDFYKVVTERNALDDMAKVIGYEKLLFTITNLEEATSRQYAPKITKPTELKRDLGKMIIFWKQEKNRITELKSKNNKKEINL